MLKHHQYRHEHLNETKHINYENHAATVCSTSSATTEIARIRGHYAVKGHSRSLILVGHINRKPVCAFLLVDNTH